jgi:hypothetical protein
MRNPLSSFIVHLSSFALLFAFGGTAGAQWIIDGQQTQTLNLNVSDPQAVYTDGSREIVASLKFAESATQNDGALQIYAKDDGTHEGYFKSLSFQDGLQFSTLHGAALFFGESANEGLLISPNYILQTGYGPEISFEMGILRGTAWHVDRSPTEDSGIVSRGYADARYLLRSEGITTTRILQAGDTLVISNGLITAINP